MISRFRSCGSPAPERALDGEARGEETETVWVSVNFLQTGWGNKQGHVSRDDVEKAVKFRQAWQEDRVAEGAQEVVEVAVDQQGRV